MGHLVASAGFVAAAVRPAVLAKVEQVAQGVKSHAQSEANDVLGVYDGVTSRPSNRAYRNGFYVRNGKRMTLTFINREVGNVDKKTNLIEFGSRAHEIAPRNATQLVWQELGGGMFYGFPGQSVWHPGTKGYMILHNAAASAR